MLSPEREAHSQAFWESLHDYPDLRFMLVGLIECNTLQEWSDRWGFKHHEQARRFLRTNVRRYLESVGGGAAVKHLQCLMSEKAI